MTLTHSRTLLARKCRRPLAPMNSFLRTHFALSKDRRGRCNWSPSYRSKTADPKSESTGDEFRSARARQFDGVGRSTPTATPCGFEVRRLGPPRMLRLAAFPCTAGYLQPIETTNEFARTMF